MVPVDLTRFIPGGSWGFWGGLGLAPDVPPRGYSCSKKSTKSTKSIPLPSQSKICPSDVLAPQNNKKKTTLGSEFRHPKVRLRYVLVLEYGLEAAKLTVDSR